MSTYCLGQDIIQKPVADVFEVINKLEIITSQALWPGFDTQKIPVAIYDSVNTYLFYADNPPEGFDPLEGISNVFVYKGQFPLVRGNSVVKFGDIWTATSVLSTYARRTGEKYTETDLAGIIIHEQFHIFQRINHPQWRQNDAILMFYPEETREALYLRRAEKEAFKRAVTSNEYKDMVGWAKVAIKYREERLGHVFEPFAVYEKELQLTEGLSDYIERIARGHDPLNASNITNEIAPAGIRDMGYVEGRWIAMILDKLKNDWKLILEKDDRIYLEEILMATIDKLGTDTQSFSDVDLEEIRKHSETDFDNWQLEKMAELEKYNSEAGYRIEINAVSLPFNIRIFEPLEIETLPERGVYHRLIFSAGNESGNLRIMNHPCITWFDNAFRLSRIVINGLKEAPEIIANENRFRLNYDKVAIDLIYKSMNEKDGFYILEL